MRGLIFVDVFEIDGLFLAGDAQEAYLLVGMIKLVIGQIDLI